MTLLEITAQFSHVRLARPDENQAVLDFFASTPMDAGALRLRYDRGPCFFDFLKSQGARSYVVIFERDEPGKNGERAIGGIGTISVRPCVHAGKKTSVAYLADLRISPHLERLPRLQFRRWYEMFVQTAAENPDLGESALMFTAILDKNKLALSSLVRKTGDVLYSPLQKYRAISIFGRWPRVFKAKRRQGFSLREVAGTLSPPLNSFFELCNSKRSFGYVYPEELRFRQDRWHGFSTHPFLVVENGHGEIVAAALPYEGDPSRRVVLEKIPRALKPVSRLLPLIKGTPVREAEVLRTLHLAHLEFRPDLSEGQRAAAVQLMLDWIFANKIFHNHHMLSLLETEAQSFAKSLKGYFWIPTPGTVYQVMSRKTQLPASVDHPSLEIATL